MRFKGRMLNEKVAVLSKLVVACQAVAEEAVMNLDPEMMQFIIEQDIVDGGLILWSGFDMASAFEDHKVESLNENHIHFRISLDHLERALKSGLSATEVVLKLAKKNGAPLLSLSTISRETHSIDVIQDIPIKMVSKKEFAMMVEPGLPDPLINILLPNLKSLTQVIDRMKTLSEFVKIKANMDGTLQISIHSDMAHVTTTYTNLLHPTHNGQEATQDPNIICAETLRIKPFRAMLRSQTIAPEQTVLCLVPGKAVVCHVITPGLYLTYYFPVVHQGV